jgi:hypothetical protein
MLRSGKDGVEREREGGYRCQELLLLSLSLSTQDHLF